MSKKTRHHPLLSFCVLCLIVGMWPSTPRSQQVKQRLEERAAHQRARGQALYGALCVGCHDGKQARDLLAKDEAWRPGPLELLGHIDAPERSSHAYTFLAEEDMMAIVQHIRAQAELEDVFDASHIPDQLSHVRQTKACPDAIRAHVQGFVDDTAPNTLERGEAIWKAACASCHADGGEMKKPAPILSEASTLWRRRATKISILQGLTGETRIPAHEGIELDEETQIWPLVSWMRVKLIPKDKLHAEPEIPMRGYVQTRCQAIFEALPRPVVPDERLFDYAAWVESLPDVPVDKDDPMAPQKLAKLEALSDTQRTHLAKLTTAPCTGCHVEGLEPLEASEAAVTRHIGFLLGERANHPAFGKTYSLQHWSAVLGAHHGEGAPVDTQSIAKILEARYGAKSERVQTEESEPAHQDR